MIFLKRDNILYIFTILTFLFPNTLLAQTNTELTRKEYIDKYKNEAIKEMKSSGIPASIKLAQALLESDNGNSILAKKANNHFGIKCHSSWTGKKVYHDDDKKKECFRHYKTVYESYKDHSEFLKKPRYAELFKLKITDYKNWAKGLKKAGYATNPRYADLLIKIIEDNKLYQYDESNKKDKQILANNEDDFSISLGRKVLYNNGVKYIIIKDGDTYIGIAKEFNLHEKHLFKFNEISSQKKLTKGEILYLQPKRSKSKNKDYHTVKGGETIHDISQKYAVKTKSLYKKNNLSSNSNIKKGMKIFLKNKKPL